MPNELSENKYPNTVLLTLKKVVFKYWYLVLLFLIVLIGVGLSIYFKYNNKVSNKVSPILTENELPPKLVSARKILDWMDKQRDEKGNYYNSIICNTESSDCDEVQKSGDSGHDVIQAIWARYLFYKKTGESKDLKILSSDLKKYADGFLVQPDFWNCKMMYEIYKDEKLTQEDRDNASKICWQSNYYNIPNITSLIKDVDTGEYGMEINFKLSEIDGISKINDKKAKLTKKESDLIKDISPENIAMFAAYPSEFIARYQWKKSDVDLELAKLHISTTYLAFIREKDNLSSGAVCNFGISLLDMWKATKDDSYLDDVSSLYNKVVLPSVSNKLKFKNYASPTCSLFLNDLYKSAGLNKSKESRDILINYLDNYIDPNQMMKAVSDGVYFSGRTPKKEIKNNALMVSLFLSI